jgi:hypothetical protein
MRAPGGFAYAQARLHARFAQLPTQSDWERLAGVRGLAAFLEEARTGALRVWIKPFSGRSDAHEIEVGLRAAYREQVAEIAGWVPERWRDAVYWTRWLVLIPLFDHLARGRPMPAWVKRDHDLQTLLDETGDLDLERLRRSGALQLFVPGGDPAGVWIGEWRRRWPYGSGQHRRGLEALQALLSQHLEDFRQSGTGTAWDLRRRLRARLGFLFHRRLLQPAAAFVYLGLVVLDMERLRSELVARALFGAGGAA